MRKLVTLIAAASIIASGVAFAGLNPEFPNLPSATYGGAKANNQGSAMCVDCHTRLPQTVGGTHFVSVDLSGDTNSSGGWSDIAGHPATVRLAAQAGEYFAYDVGAAYWSSTGYSKYFNGTASVIVVGATADLGNGNVDEPLLSTDDTVAPDYFTSVAGVANPGTYDLICESCHNIITNVAGGNHLLEDLTSEADWAVADAVSAPICVGCHGYMYSDMAFSNAAGGGVDQVAAANGDANWGAAENSTAYAGKRGNNEAHNIAGLPYAMNHHVTTGDTINAAKIGQGYAWRDVLAFALGDYTMNAGTATGQYPVDGVWAADKAKPATLTNFNCLNCHGPGHGAQGGVTLAAGDLGASIIRDATAPASLLGDAATRIERLSDGGRNWMGFADTYYCNNCHHLPGAAATGL